MNGRDGRHALVTGGAGFIGSHLVDRLLDAGWQVTAVDNFDRFYDPATKAAHVAPHRKHPRYRLVVADIRDVAALRRQLQDDYGVIVHLAARAGVRHSLSDPEGYQQVNVGGTQNLLELARERGVPQFVFASSSSVYGANPNVPWREDDAVLLPISPYAATKVAGELLGHVYSHLYGLHFIALRLFSVFGPRQRPDLAIHKFARLMLAGEPIPVYGDGSARRDYTYIDDVVHGIQSAMVYEGSRYEVINLGNNQTVSLTEVIRSLALALGTRCRIQRLPEQPGDLPQTWADISKAERLLGYRTKVEFAQGLAQFAAWLTGEATWG